MLRSRAGLLSLACLVTGACSSTPATLDASVQPQLCDGLPHLRLWAFLTPMSDSIGATVRIENGYPFVAIDGTCAYRVDGGWVNDPLGRDRPIRTGQLSADQIQSLDRNVPVSALTPLADCPPGSDGLFDAPTRVFRTATEQVTCAGFGTGTRFDRSWTVVAALASALWDTGTAVADRAIHVSAVSAAPEPPPAPLPYAWPLSLPLSSFLLQGPDLDRPGVSHAVADPVEAAALRAVRDQYLKDRAAQPGLYSNWDGVQVTDQTMTAFVYLRDATPDESSDGLLQF